MAKLTSPNAADRPSLFHPRFGKAKSIPAVGNGLGQMGRMETPETGDTQIA